MRIIFSTIIFLLLSNVAFAQKAEIPFIEVNGISATKVVPNQFAFHIQIKSFDKKLEVASAETTKRVAAITKKMTSMGVARKYVVASEITVRMETKGYRERGNFKFLGYHVQRDVRIVLHKPGRIQPAIKKVFKVGVESLSISYHHTDIALLQKNAEVAAMRDAKKKADRLLGAIGAQAGRPIAVVATSSSGSRRSGNFTYNVNTPDLGAGFSLGKIDIQQSVNVKFQIK